MTRLPKCCGYLGKVAKDLHFQKLCRLLFTYLQLHCGTTTSKAQGDRHQPACSCFCFFFFFFLCNDLLFSALTFFYLLVSMPMRSFLNDQFFLSCISFRKALSLPHTEYDLSVFLLLFLVFLFDILPLPPLLQSFRATKVRVSTKWGFGGKVTFSLSPFPIMFLMCGVPSVVL